VSLSLSLGVRSKGLVVEEVGEERIGGSGKLRDRPECFKVMFIEIGEGGRGLS